MAAVTVNENVDVVQPAGEGTPQQAGGERGIDARTWVDAHGDALFRFAMLRLRNAHEAEEAVQECLLAALDAKHAFAGRSSERTWLIGILKNKIVDRFRRRSALEPVGEAISRKIFDQNGLWRSAPRKWQGDPEEAAQDAEFGAVLHECLRKLPHALRDVTILRELDNIGSGEIADMLDTSQANVWQRLHRARLALRACLEANWFNPPKQARTKRT